MSELTDRMRVLADISAGDRVMCYGLELTAKLREAADELDRLKSELDAKTTTLKYLQQNEDAAANVARQAAANAIRECQRLRKDRDRLQAIVDRLPKTADGVPIYPGMTVFARLRCAVTEVDVPKVGCGGVYAQCYSTRDAAEKARQQP